MTQTFYLLGNIFCFGYKCFFKTQCIVHFHNSKKKKRSLRAVRTVGRSFLLINCPLTPAGVYHSFKPHTKFSYKLLYFLQKNAPPCLFSSSLRKYNNVSLYNFLTIRLLCIVIYFSCMTKYGHWKIRFKITWKYVTFESRETFE